MVALGYCRVSKSDGSQALDLQKDALIAAGVAPDAIYEDHASGKNDDRPGLASALKALRPGDVLTIWKLDRLGRSLPHLVETVHGLGEKGIGFRVLTGAPIDTSTKEGKLMFAIFAGLAEFERDLLIERVNAGLASARARGRVGGRRPGITKAGLRRAQAAMQHRDTNVAELCKELGISKTALFRYVGPTGEIRPMGRKILGMVEGAA